MKIISHAAQDALFAVRRFALGPNRARRAQIYGVGIGKSGTHSLANMFSRTVRARHEPQSMQVIDHFLDWHNRRISEAEMAAWIRQRDREMALEVDSSGLNFPILDLLLREFPHARFVLTVRDCYSWTNSMMNEEVRSANADERWSRMRRYYHEREPVVYTPEEQLLKENKLYPLDRYFSHWAMRNEQVIAKVPGERLFVVRTDQLKQRALELADFAGLPRRAIRLQRTHEFKNPDKRPILREIDRGFVEHRAEKYCRPIMTRFFPEIKSLHDAKL
jgi:hypothetical protein